MPNFRSKERLKRHIIDGERIGLEDALKVALEKYPPLEIINVYLLDGMKTVCELFGSGQMQLPFVLQSAETMKSAVAFLEPLMEKKEAGQSKGVMLIATVKRRRSRHWQKPGRHHSHQQRLQGDQPRNQTVRRQDH